MCKSCILGLVFLTAVVLATCGCTTTPTTSPPTTPGSAETMQTLPVTEEAGADTEFLSMYEDSVADIGSRLESVNGYFYAETTDIDLTYSPSKLRLAALDLKDAADGYHTAFLKIEGFESKENEYLRNEYLGYLSSIRNAGENIAQAAQAEGAGDYRLAMNYAEIAKTSLERIEGVPNTGQQAQITAMVVNLDDMITRMKEAITS